MPTETNSESEHPIQVLNDGQHSLDQATFLTSGGAMLLRPTVKVTNNVMVPQPTLAVNTPSSSTGLSLINAQSRSQNSANTGMWDTFRRLFLKPTSNPGHSGRIVCSEGFITVSLAQDLDEEKQEPTIPEVYIRSMLTSGMGLASWEPSPYDGERGTEPGDVGTFTAAGGFRKILNLWEDAEDIRRHGAALPEICGYTPPDKKISTRRGALLPPNPIRNGTTVATRYTDDGNISSFEFNMTAPKGAVLVSTSRADLEELVNYIKLRDFIIGNAGLLYQYVNMVRGLDQDESLYIVTGCIKSESWAMAAFTEPTVAPHDVLRLVRGRGSDPTPPYVWTSQGTALVKSFHPEEHTDDANVIVNRKNQTLFMHGFKLSFSSEFCSRWSSPSAPRGSSPRSDSDFSDEGGRRDGQDDTHRGSSGKGKRGDGADGSGIGPVSSIGHALSTGVSIQTFPERHTEIILHPLDVTNRQLLDLTNADFALTHDDDWRFTLQGMTLDDVDSFNALRTSNVSVSNGVAFLVNGDPRMQDLATQISTFNIEDLQQNPRELDPRRLVSLPKHPDMSKARLDYLPDSRKPDVDHIYKRESSSTDIGTHNTPVDDLLSSDSEQKRTAEMSMAFLPSQTNLSHHPLHLNHLEQGDIGRTYGPIFHSSLQSSSSMCFRTEHRTIKRRPAPYSVVYRQQRFQGPIYKGNISGGVNFYMSGGDSDILQYLREHAATGAMHDSDERLPPPLCQPGTREAVIYRVLDWYGYQKQPGKPIMWVYAPAGSGKTAVAGTVATKLEEKFIELDFNPLGATFFFWRTSPDRNSPAQFVITLTYQLFVSVPELAPHIENAIKRDPMILSQALEVQLMKLIIGPFKALGDTKDMPNRLIIIDGLDECINSDQESRAEKKYVKDQERVQIRVLDLIYTLASHQFPLSFLILSRPEAWIKQHMESQKFEDLVEFVNLYKPGDNMNDVERFVREGLSRLGVDDEDLVQQQQRSSIASNFSGYELVNPSDLGSDDEDAGPGFNFFDTAVNNQDRHPSSSPEDVDHLPLVPFTTTTTSASTTNPSSWRLHLPHHSSSGGATTTTSSSTNYYQTTWSSDSLSNGPGSSSSRHTSAYGSPAQNQQLHPQQQHQQQQTTPKIAARLPKASLMSSSTSSSSVFKDKDALNASTGKRPTTSSPLANLFSSGKAGLNPFGSSWSGANNGGSGRRNYLDEGSEGEDGGWFERQPLHASLALSQQQRQPVGSITTGKMKTASPGAPAPVTVKSATPPQQPQTAKARRAAAAAAKAEAEAKAIAEAARAEAEAQRKREEVEEARRAKEEEEAAAREKAVAKNKKAPVPPSKPSPPVVEEVVPVPSGGKKQTKKQKQAAAAKKEKEEKEERERKEREDREQREREEREREEYKRQRREEEERKEREREEKERKEKELSAMAAMKTKRGLSIGGGVNDGWSAGVEGSSTPRPGGVKSGWRVKNTGAKATPVQLDSAGTPRLSAATLRKQALEKGNGKLNGAGGGLKMNRKDREQQQPNVTMVNGVKIDNAPLPEDVRASMWSRASSKPTPAPAQQQPQQAAQPSAGAKTKGRIDNFAPLPEDVRASMWSRMSSQPTPAPAQQQLQQAAQPSAGAKTKGSGAAGKKPSKMKRSVTIEEVSDDEADGVLEGSLPFGSRYLLEESGLSSNETESSSSIQQPQPSVPLKIYNNLFEYEQQQHRQPRRWGGFGGGDFGLFGGGGGGGGGGHHSRTGSMGQQQPQWNYNYNTGAASSSATSDSLPTTPWMAPTSPPDDVPPISNEDLFLSATKQLKMGNVGLGGKTSTLADNNIHSGLASDWDATVKAKRRRWNTVSSTTAPGAGAGRPALSATASSGGAGMQSAFRSKSNLAPVPSNSAAGGDGAGASMASRSSSGSSLEADGSRMFGMGGFPGEFPDAFEGSSQDEALARFEKAQRLENRKRSKMATGGW